MKKLRVKRFKYSHDGHWLEAEVHTRMGAGTQLLEALEACALEHEFQRMELSVMTTNSAAIGRYKRRGFDIEGEKRSSVRLKTDLVDEIMMGKLLVG